MSKRPITPEQAIKYGFLTEIQRSRDADTWQTVFDGTGFLWTDTNLEPETDYYYRVRNYVTEPETYYSDWSETIRVRTSGDVSEGILHSVVQDGIRNIFGDDVCRQVGGAIVSGVPGTINKIFENKEEP